MLNQAALLLAFAAASATAEVEVVQAVRIIENIKLQSLASSNVIVARQDAGECYTSASSILGSAPTPAPDVEDAVVSQTESCLWTVHSSLSEDLMEYMTELADWAQGAEGSMEKLLEDCKDHIQVDTAAAAEVCTPAGTILFTGSANSTSTVALETELPAATGSGDGESAAARGMGISAVAAAAALVGAVFLL
ncbi:hypothetical protein BN1708_006895, partial [Verticillium longisporum]